MIQSASDPNFQEENKCAPGGRDELIDSSQTYGVASRKGERFQKFGEKIKKKREEDTSAPVTRFSISIFSTIEDDAVLPKGIVGIIFLAALIQPSPLSWEGYY